MLKKLPTDRPDSSPGRAPVEPRLLVLHSVGVDGDAAHVGGRHEPVKDKQLLISPLIIKTSGPVATYSLGAFFISFSFC
jgi:hypothetical protein